jgi:hypothetical protein
MPCARWLPAAHIVFLNRAQAEVAGNCNCTEVADLGLGPGCSDSTAFWQCRLLTSCYADPYERACPLFFPFPSRRFERLISPASPNSSPHRLRAVL